MERLVIKHRLISMYKPSTNGFVERMNKDLVFYDCEGNGNKGECY